MTLEEPRLRFSGTAYHDANAGDLPLETTFAEWTWSRAHTPKSTLITYDLAERSGARKTIGLELGNGDGSCGELHDLGVSPLPTTRWRLRRNTRADVGASTRVVRELEDTPFYSRSLIDVELQGRRGGAVHESLSLDRFRKPWVRSLLGFRMTRGS